MDIPAHRRCIWVGPYCARRHAHDATGRRSRSLPAFSPAADGVASKPTTRSVAAAPNGGPYTGERIRQPRRAALWTPACVV